MSEDGHMYIAIDLKSFYASVECVERGLDPLTTNLVVADVSRTEKTICLAVSPSLKAYGISGRARLFEVVQGVKVVNADRLSKLSDRRFSGSSYDDNSIKADITLAVDYIAASPRMALYMEYSTRIFDIYLRYISPEDIHVYSVDEVFMDVTHYLDTYRMSPRELAMKMVHEVLKETGITATAGIGTNMYLCKIAMDIVAKKMPADKDGVRIAELDELSYRRILWNHQPITDFWRVGGGYARRLASVGLYTMGDVARCSIGKPGEYYNEDLLYKLFGINAELLIDHAWGWEPVKIKHIKSYKPSVNSLSSGQVLQSPYNYEKAKLIVREMTDLLILDLVDKGLVTDQMVLTIGYDVENFKNPDIIKSYTGPVTTDHYGRKIPKHANGTVNLTEPTSSTRIIIDAVMNLFPTIVDERLLVRRINITANHVVEEASVPRKDKYEQLSLFTDYSEQQKKKEVQKKAIEREKRMQHAVLDIKKKYGKNAVIKGMNLKEGAMTIERNRQIGGHKA